MTTVELKVSLPDELASQAEAAGILTAEGIERLVREALKREARRLPRPSSDKKAPWGQGCTEIARRA